MSDELGLRPGHVRVAAYSDSWSAAFESERALLVESLGGLAVDIQHVGSTAVPAMCAKPIIDIAIAVRERSLIESVNAKLLARGYGYALDAGSEGGHIFFKTSSDGVRTHHLHVIEFADIQWRNYLYFRDRLRNEPRLRADYALLKQRLARRHAEDRDGYTAGKSEFISRALAAPGGAVKGG